MTAGLVGLLISLLTPAEAPLPPGLPPGGVRIGPLHTFIVGEPEAPLSQYPVTALPGDDLARLLQAQGLREAGEIDAARDSVRAIMKTYPHHPLVLAEMSRNMVARNDWSGIERMARAERTAQHDSLLLGRDLSMALERLKKPREAAQVALECWAVLPTEAEWAFSSIARVAGSDSKGVRETVRKFVASFPDRVDLQSAAARLEWKMGDGAAAQKALVAADRPGLTPPLRWRFADELLRTSAARDSAGAVEALLGMAGDVRFDPSHRMLAAVRVMEVQQARGAGRAAATELYKALKDIPPERWQPNLLLAVARGLREAGDSNTARTLLATPGLNGHAKQTANLERSLNDLRDGPPEKALESLAEISETSAEARFRYAEALFFAGKPDTALGAYKALTEDARGPYTGAALERMFLIEDAQPRTALPIVGHLYYLVWRGDAKPALDLSDSLYRALPSGTLWAQVALVLSQQLEAAGQYQAAIDPMLAVADKDPGDRLAPVALQRAGDLYLDRLKSEPDAITQYETCLTRYPKAWNSAEVRRKLETLRKSRF